MKKNHRYVIVDTNNMPVTISGYFDNLDEAKARCNSWRKKRYSNGNIVKEFEYDNLSVKPDMFLNVIEISEYLY